MITLLLILAIAALLSGTDRQCREFPNSPSFVGWPYDTGAARSRAMRTFVTKGPAHAIGFARRAIASDPISVQAVSLLGQVMLYSQHTDEAHKAFYVSGQLGWRDRMTQIYWLDQALQSEDYKVASERLDALLRQAPLDESRDRLLAAMAATDAGRAALADRLKLSPAWARTIVTYVDDLPTDQLLERIDLMRRSGKGVWDCPDSEKITQRLINLGLIAAAQSIWQLNCDSSGALIYDGGLERIDTIRKPMGFNWQIASRGDVNVAIVNDVTGHHNLALEVTGVTTLPILRQVLSLKQGRYNLTWATPATNPARADSIQVSLGCGADLSRASSGTRIPGERYTWRLLVEVDGKCPVQQLIFWLAPRTPIHLDDIRLSRID